MFAERFNALRARIDALKSGGVPLTGVFGRARSFFVRHSREIKLTELLALDEALDHAGIHTSADAKLLFALGSSKGRLSQLKSGLVQRAELALDEFETALESAEHFAGLGEREASQVLALDTHFPKLARVVKVATVFSAADASGAKFELYEVKKPPVGEPPVSAKLAIVEFLSERAKTNVGDVSEKRRDLDLAHELLLRMGALSKNDRDRARRLRIEVGSARDRVRTLPAVRSLEELSRHLRHTARRDSRTAYRSLRGLYDRAVEANDAELAAVASLAIESVLTNSKNVTRLVERAERQRLFAWNDSTLAQVGSESTPGGKGGLDDAIGDALAQLAFGLDEDKVKALELAAGAQRLFDVEDALTEEFVQAEVTSTRPVQRRVTYPTQMMTYEVATNLDEVHNFVVSHPGSMVLDLAAGRQMVRAYLDEEPPPKPKRLKQTSVRVYVLDASGSMHGARARFRDAILIAELNAIRVKGKLNLPFDPLYFSFFNDTPTELTRVESAKEATAHIESLFRSSPAEGQTDISLAVMAAFESIRNAQGKDPYLSRATVVLVTDGEDGVDLELIRKAKKPFAGLDISLSFISLGEENTDLKSLVTEQRASGSRAFYHHLSDAEISLVRSDFDSTWRTLLPPDIDATPEVLERLLPHLEALDAIAANRVVKLRPKVSDQFETLFPEGVGPAKANAKVVARIVDVLDAIADAAALAPADQRANEAVTLLGHLLEVYRLPMPRYLEALGADDETLRASLKRVRLLCRPLD